MTCQFLGGVHDDGLPSFLPGSRLDINTTYNLASSLEKFRELRIEPNTCECAKIIGCHSLGFADSFLSQCCQV